MSLSSESKKHQHRVSNRAWNRKITDKAKSGDKDAISYKEKRAYDAKFSTSKTFISRIGKIEDVRKLKGLLDERLKEK